MLAVKLGLVPLLIALLTLAGRRWGAAVAGWLSALPLVAGPILFFVAREQGSAFAAHAAVGTLSAVLAILVFGIGYAHAATQWNWPASLLAALAVYALAVAALTAFPPSLALAAMLNVAALLLAPRLFPIPTPSAPLAPSAPLVSAAPAGKGAADLPWRMLAGGLLVLLVTGCAAQLGPQLSGLFAMFPVMSSVLVVFSHRRAGAPFAITLLRGMILGWYAFSSFCIVLVWALPLYGIGLAFAAAAACALLVQAASHRFVRLVA